MVAKVKIKSLHPDFKLPERATAGSAGFDMRYLPEGRRLDDDNIEDANVVLPPGTPKKLFLGCSVELPPTHEMQMRPRSGLAFNHGVTLVNAPGTIDADYRGKLYALMVNLSSKTFVIEPGMRICQAVVAPVDPVEYELVEELSETDRADGGLGSTGLK